MRGDFHRYFVYTDYLVVLILGVVLNRYEKKISLLFATVALILIFLVNQNFIEGKKNSLNFDNINNLCLQIEEQGYTEGSIYYFSAWASRIPMNKIKNFCTNNQS